MPFYKLTTIYPVISALNFIMKYRAIFSLKSQFACGTNQGKDSWILIWCKTFAKLQNGKIGFKSAKANLNQPDIKAALRSNK